MRRANGLALVSGMALGAVGARFALDNPEWVATHPGTLLAAAVGLLCGALAVVQVRMNRHERGHELRLQAFAEAMIAE